MSKNTNQEQLNEKVDMVDKLLAYSETLNIAYRLHMDLFGTNEIDNLLNAKLVVSLELIGHTRELLGEVTGVNK